MAERRRSPRKGARDKKKGDFFSSASCAFLRPIVLAFVMISSGCSVPSLESPACTEAKNTIREFYSFHFGNDMKFSAEDLKTRERYLTPEFAKTLLATSPGTDPFTTGSEDIPKAFRVGECREISTEKTESNVLLFWRTDDRTEQRQIRVEAIDKNDRWLINAIAK